MEVFSGWKDRAIRLFNILEKILRSSSVHCLLLLHFFGWSAEDKVNGILALLVLSTVVYFQDFGYIGILAYKTAGYFVFIVRILQGLFRVIFVFAIYEIILEVIGYHSEDYKKLKHNMQLVFTEFSSTSCSWTLNMTTKDGTIMLEASDVVSLCNLTWNAWYLGIIGAGLYMGMPDYTRVKKNYFWLNLYLSLMMLVVWKAFESFLWHSFWNRVKFERATCLFVHYIRNGEDGFKSASFIEGRSRS